ncbi:hypothetical protein DMB38_30785 [Streptomyces sp. WAC 06738]|uniref:hypothetical protein n=1 Tax=Streptomyces sp. WAC 06738 TaxID=2203210 RepID=UPI000F70C649|nr:hypothetical protein [Streptomyces sp. WAC 06738]AZM49585.1 hypothetical protein DMB38_30785 [Streptomyces sp. WAC 06738]
MVTPVAPEIDSALDHPDPRQAVERVKDVIQRRLLLIHPQARIIRTDFFNHSYVPDLLMTWNSGTRKGERRIYLRASADPDLLASDVMLLEREQQPLVVPLAQVDVDHSQARLEAVAEEHDTLILDPSGLGALPAHTLTRSPTALASDAIVEGGRGIMSQDRVEHFLTAVGSGVEAARAGRTDPTREALSEVTRRTVPTVSRRMATFMAAMWQGSGRSLLEFPGDAPVRSTLDETSLSLLLGSREIPDEDFWRRIRPLVTAKTLLGTDVRDTPNLQHLMRSAIQIWKGHVCMIVDDRRRSPDSGTDWRWVVDNGRLGLCGPGFTAYLAASRKELDFPEEHPAPLLAQVRDRASRFSIALTSIRMLMTNRSIGYDAPGEDVTHDPQLDGISAAFGQEEGVVEALALTPTRTPLRCNFTTRTASPPGARSLLPYAELLGTTLRLFLDLDDEDAAHLEGLLYSGEPAPAHWTQADLFEE